MRLALAVSRFGTGVGDPRVWELARAFAGRGAKVTVVAGRVADEPIDEQLGAITVRRVSASGKFALARGAFAELMSRSGVIDAIWAPAGCPAARAAAAAGRWNHVPTILRVGVSGEDAVVGFWSVWAFRRAVKLGTWIVSEDPRAPKRLAPGARLRYWAVPEGVDASVFAPLSEQGKAVRRRELGLGDGLVFACPARADDDLGALAKLWTAAAPEGALLAVAGDAAIEPSPGVRLLGPRADLYKVYQAADAAVFPPGAPVTDVLEAMATGLAVLAPSDRATMELVEEGRTGHVYEPGYPQQLEARLRDMLAKPARLAAIGEEARSRVLKTHSFERVAHRYMDMLEGAVQAKTRFFMRK